MFLYRIEMTMPEGKAVLIVLSESDAKAFEYAEGHLARHYIKTPEVLEMVLVEKKRVEKGSGYIVESM